MDNNIDPNTMNNIKNLVDNGNISDAISQISPEMIQNFSKMLNSSAPNSSSNSQKTKNATSSNESNNKNTYNSNSSKSGFDFNQIDMNTILKMKSVMEKMNNTDDPRSNLLYSLKPYLRQTKQEKLDQYVNLLNFSKVADILKNDKKGDNNA